MSIAAPSCATWVFCEGCTNPARLPAGPRIVGFPGFAPGSPSPMRGVLDHRVIRTHQSCLGLRAPISRGRLLNDQPVCPPHRYVARACDTTVCALRPTGLWAVVYLWRALGLHAWGRTSLRRPQPAYQGLGVNLACPGGLRGKRKPPSSEWRLFGDTCALRGQHYLRITRLSFPRLRVSPHRR